MKGFTLIELLAVIIILAIVSLIATPLVFDIISDSKKSANLTQSYMILKGAEMMYTSSLLNDDLTDSFDGVTDVYDLIEFNGSKPDDGMVMIDKSGNISMAVIIDEVCYTKYNNESKVHVTNIGEGVNCYLNEEGSPVVGLTYEKLDYIYSDGEQYIDTGLFNTGNYIIEDEVYLESTNSLYMSWLFGGRSDFAYGYGVLVQKLSNGVMELFALHGGSSIPIRFTTSVFDKWIKVSFSKDSIVFDGNVYNTSGGIMMPSDYETEIRLGGMSQTMGADNRNFVGMRRRTVITDVTSGDVVRDYIPVKINETDEVGYWDLVNNQFYSNNGSGEFGY